MDYAVPTFADVPPIETHHIETRRRRSPAASRGGAKPARQERPPRFSTPFRRDADRPADHAGARRAGARGIEIARLVRRAAGAKGWDSLKGREFIEAVPAASATPGPTSGGPVC